MADDDKMRPLVRKAGESRRCGEGRFPLACAFRCAAAGIAYAYVRFLTQRGEDKAVIIFYFSTFSCLVSVPFMIVGFAPMTLFQTLALIGAGIAAAIGQFGMTNAYARAPGRFLGPFEYSQLLFSAIYSFFIFSEVPTAIGLVGYAIILVVSIWMLKSGD